ncbi:predicted protein [Cyanophage NATL2A-133]|uniref:Predicted protein n=1 Tax=Cyanophage NATL2A-133 TaxID=445692 RepID=E3SP38_9CAUD|nr:tail fiber protein [Cyanophage NATL2A-133]ADP00155.1 predicted protein [Cyanophage NATL2A-133]
MKKALIFNNEVIQVEDAGKEFEVSPEMKWMDADDSVTTDYTLVKGVLTAPDTSIKEKDWEKFRSSRDNYLLKSDWTQTADSPLSDSKKAEWKAYRTKLRDLPAGTTDPRKPTWPTKPS